MRGDERMQPASLEPSLYDQSQGFVLVTYIETPQ